ncbi:50S ribosomal protein L31 [Candidatus Marinamargulisbacteria bacterium SCGC AG-414-C22]|nr:50S ribosomal protein L31 [Candidatus Marinamargulisbacteria bacterium SCGC AG-414-C22]
MVKEKTKSAGLNLGAKASKKDKYIKISKEEIVYHKKAKISCVCGAEYDAGSTLETIRLDICANCHPFFTGEKRILDAEGRVEKFRKKYNLSK